MDSTFHICSENSPSKFLYLEFSQETKQVIFYGLVINVVTLNVILKLGSKVIVYANQLKEHYCYSDSFVFIIQHPFTIKH